MNLTPVQTSELAVGQPLPWDLFDKDHQQVLARGKLINTADELQELTQAPLFRVPEAAPAAATDAAPEFSFQDMRLSVGDKLQLSLPSNPGDSRCIVPLIGYVDGVTLIVGAPPPGQLRSSLHEGDEIAIRVFSGQYAFGLFSSVDKIIKAPFEYLHLSFPKHIVGKIVRKSRRIKTSIAAAIAGNPSPAIISNLSATGAEVRANLGPDQLGATIGLSFALTIIGVETQLSLQAVIRSLKQDRDCAEGAFRCGVEFQGLQASDLAALQGVIYQELVEHPQNLA